MSRINRIFKIFLIFILFFNCLFFTTMQDSLASSDSVGAKDRLRSLLNTGKKGINYTYSPENGFSCKPGGVLFYGEENVSEYKKCNSDCGNDFLCKTDCFFDEGLDVFGTWAWDVLVDVLLAPILCVSTFYVATNVVSQKSAVVSILGPIALLFVSSGIDKLTEIIAGEDDFNLDSTNKSPICQGLYWTNFAICLLIIVALKLPKSVPTWIKILIIVGLSTTFYIVKETLAGIQHKNADQAFGKLALCGDEWLTYGSTDLEAYVKNSNIRDIRLDIINNALNSSGNDRKSFPSKGSYFGAYKYALDKCFKDKSADFCNKIFSTKNITTDTIDNYANTYYKQYREFLYGGVEYANTFTSSCVDPRPERKYYKGVGKGDTKSQLYYFKGTDAANFACDRFLEKSTTEYMKAYECCLEASQNTICIRSREEGRGDVYTFCSPNSDDGECVLSDDSFSFSSFSASDLESTCNNIKEAMSESQNGFDVSSSSEYSYYKFVGSFKTSYFRCPRGTECRTLVDCTNNKDCTETDETTYNANTTSFSIPESDMSNFNSANEKLNDFLCNQKPEDIKNVSFKIKKSHQTIDSEYDKYCVETYNLCPYNFPILGGTEQIGQDFMQTIESGIPVTKSKDSNEYVEDYGTDNEKILSILTGEDEALKCSISEDGTKKICDGACIEVKGEEVKIKPCFNKPSNLCQIDRHCVYIKRILPKETRENSPYLSTACINNVGSSHNFLNYSRSYGADSSRLLTAPLVECSVETFKNMLFNRAGHTKCLISGEKPDLNNTCLSGEEYKEGENLEKYNIDGPFKKLQENLMEIVKIILAIAIVLYGFKIIIKNNSSINVEDITQFILTSVFVVYFTMTTSWKEPVFNAVYGTSNYIVNLSSKIIRFDRVSSTNYDSIYKNPNYQGCYFFKHDEIPNNYEDYGIGKSYLALFDTLDCKISRYFGITTDNVINIPIISFFIAGIFSFGFAIMTIMPFILLTIGIIAIAIKIALQFITYSLELTILLFIAPLIIPLYLIENTRGIFNSWINNIVKLVFRPMFTILSTMLFLLIFDKYYIGDAKFYGIREPVRDIYCGKICKIDDNNFYYIYENSSNSSEEAISIIQECEERAKGKVIDLGDESPMCIVSSQEIVGNSGSSLVDMFISGFAGFPSVISNSLDLFKIFSDMIFLLLLLGIFDRFINEAGIEIFGKLGETDFTVSGILSKASSVMIKIANITNVLPKKGIKEIMANKTEFNSNRTDNKIKRKIGADYYDENKDAIHNESLEKPKEK